MLKNVALESDILRLYSQLCLPLAVCPEGATLPLWASAAQLSEITDASNALWENEPKQSWKKWCRVWLRVRAHGLPDSTVTADGGETGQETKEGSSRRPPTPTPKAYRGHAHCFSKAGPTGPHETAQALSPRGQQRPEGWNETLSLGPLPEALACLKFLSSDSGADQCPESIIQEKQTVLTSLLLN